MKKKLIIASIASLIVNGGMFGAGAERKAVVASKANCIKSDLITAVATGNLRGIDLALSFGAKPNPDDTDGQGLTIFMIAARDAKEARVLKYLIKEFWEFSEAGKKEVLNAQDNNGLTALDYAKDRPTYSDMPTTIQTKKEMEEILIKNGAQPSTKS